MTLEITLIEIRKKMNMTQKDLAKKLNISGQFISNIERGKARLPLAYFHKVSKALDIPIKHMIRLRAQDIEQDMINEFF